MQDIFENCWYDAVLEMGEAASCAIDLKRNEAHGEMELFLI